MCVAHALMFLMMFVFAGYPSHFYLPADFNNSYFDWHRPIHKNHCLSEIPWLQFWQGKIFPSLLGSFLGSIAGNDKRVLPSQNLSCSFFFFQLETQYFHHHATFTTAVALKQCPAVDLSITLGTPTFALGAEASYETATSKLTKYTAGISVTKPDSCAAIIL